MILLIDGFIIDIGRSMMNMRYYYNYDRVIVMTKHNLNSKKKRK